MRKVICSTPSEPPKRQEKTEPLLRDGSGVVNGPTDSGLHAPVFIKDHQLPIGAEGETEPGEEAHGGT